MEGPLELPEGHRQPAQGDVALGPRIAQALGLGGQMSLHLGQQIRLVKVEGLAQFEPERAAGGCGCRKAELEDGGGPAVKVSALGGGDQNQAGFGGGRFKRSDQRRFQIGGH